MAPNAPVPTANSRRRRASRTADTIIAAKLALPGLPRWVVCRPRIDKRVTEGARGPLTLVSGPPGAGKTMAMASWAAGNAGSFPIAWVTLDEYDNRPRAFWSYVVAALRRAGVEVPRTVWATGRAVDHRFMIRLTTAIAGSGSPVVLVLDDLHRMTERRSLNGLDLLLRNARPHLRLVVASRRDPLLPLHRYRLAGELTEIRAGELAFSVDEASLLMAQHDISLPAESIEFLTARADGWVAALRLAAISMSNHPDPARFVQEVAAEDGAVAGYLVEEVLNTLPADVRNLLLRTSILDRVSAGLASELADRDAPAALPTLTDANAFIQPMGGGWYRYHPLLAEVLRLKLRREDPDLVPDLHRRAARWLRREGALTEAVQQAAAAGDWQLAARIAIDELAVSQLIEPSGAEPLAEALRCMPQGQAWSEPQPLLVTAALRVCGGSADAVAAAVAAAAALLAQVPEGEQIPSRLSLALIRLVLSQRAGDLRAAAEAAADASALVGRVPPAQLALHPGLSDEVLARRGSVEFWSGHFDQAAASLRAAADAVPCASQWVGCLGHLALLEAWRGRLSHAAELAQRAFGADTRDQVKVDRGASPAALVAQAYVHLERNELPAARRWLRRADEALRMCPERLIVAVACLVAARCCLAEGRAGPVFDLVSRALSGWSPPPWLERSLVLAQSQALLAEGNAESAADAARRAGADRSLEATVALARALLAVGDVQAAENALAGAPGADRAPDRARLQAWLAHARIWHGRGDRQRCHRSLQVALRLASPEQLRLPFALERAWIRGELQGNPDLARAYRRLLDPAPLSQDSSARSPVPPPGKLRAVPAGSAVPRQPAPVVVEKLSDREREVLQHVSQMLDTSEIAAEMFVSVNTVKSHLKSVFRKLGAVSRNEAVRRARQLQLI